MVVTGCFNTRDQTCHPKVEHWVIFPTHAQLSLTSCMTNFRTVLDSTRACVVHHQSTKLSDGWASKSKLGLDSRTSRPEVLRICDRK